MPAARLVLVLALMSGLSGAATAFDAAQVGRVTERYLASEKTEDMSAEAQQYVLADLDGDGRQEIVLLWSLLGPTYWYTHLSVLTPAGKDYRASKADIVGLAEGVRVEGREIVVDTKVLGKNDARCCPSVKKAVRFRWNGQQLTAAKK